jgi:hypothetical protein
VSKRERVNKAIEGLTVSTTVPLTEWNWPLVFDGFVMEESDMVSVEEIEG